MVCNYYLVIHKKYFVSIGIIIIIKLSICKYADLHTTVGCVLSSVSAMLFRVILWCYAVLFHAVLFRAVLFLLGTYTPRNSKSNTHF